MNVKYEILRIPYGINSIIRQHLKILRFKTTYLFLLFIDT